jgi:hypothetical protein
MLEYIRNFVINEDVEFEANADKGLIDVKGVAVYKVGKDKTGLDHICNFETEEHRDGKAPELEVSFGAGNGDKLLEIRVGLHRDVEASYANYFQMRLERPFVFEFPAEYSVEDMVKLINDIMGMSDHKVFTASVSGSKIKISGVLGTQTLKAKTAVNNGEEFAHEKQWTNMEEFDLVMGERPFGTYENLLHDLGLPTIENYNYFSPNKYEMPIPGKKYDLYVFDYNSGLTHRSAGIVGSRFNIYSTHKFWVASDIAADANIRKVLAALKKNEVPGGAAVASEPATAPVIEEVED